ncbi:nicotinate-nucleotide--dimethylbenzimidazole phosphoribosyltransferase [Streptomyces gossypiisoli]|uniref:nicotinate-nucleotide--dimethylbenzimidazole phosphoribosyltransferase n=1 Tax=Streptomyces gossypiisoli TaxID=2748864 RepID=UPI0015DAA112|nr:nicotinate-nucleotide--dimethylbenzimidazole phosphoribosyltransferase [Streptomyces gossypiisoli]
MTDTGQVPGEGLPENAGLVEQPGVPVPGAYTYVSETPAEDEDLLLPGAQGAWGNEVAPPPPEPVVEAVHEPGAHEMSGRDSGSVDLTGVRLPGPTPPPPSPAPAAAPRRPLHLGPPIPDVSASPVRSLADRGPAGAPVRQPGPPTTGPEYLDVPRVREMPPQGAVPQGAVPQGAVPWGGAQAAATQPAAVQTPVSAEATPAETVVPAGRVQGQAQAQAEVQAPAEVQAQAQVEATAPAQVQVQAQVEAPAPVQVQAQAEAQVPAEVQVQAQAHGGPEPVDAAQAAVARIASEAVASGTSGQGEADAGEAGAAADQALGPDAGTGDHAAVPADVPADAGAVDAQPLPSDAEETPATPATPAIAEEAEPIAEPVSVPEPEQLPGTPEGAPAHGAEEAPAAEEAPTADEAPAAEAVQAPRPAQAAGVAEPEPAPAAEAAPAPAPEPQQPAAVDMEAQGVAPAVDEPLAQPVPHPEHIASAPEPEYTEPEPEPVAPAEEQPQDTAPDATPAPQPEQPLGQFVPVEGSVPTTPHLAPTPPHPIVLPTQEQLPEPPAQPEAVATVPAPREADATPATAAPEETPATEPVQLVQNAEDLETRAADQEDQQDQQDQQNSQHPQETSTAPVAEAPQSTGPAAPPYDDAEREAVLKVMRERRDIRNGFRSDPIPHEVLLRVLEAAHTAPSVGHSQPWDFVVIRSAETRRTMHELAMRQRDAYAKSLPKGRAKQFKELKIEAILDTPVNIVVTADPTRGGRHTLGRHTQPQMAPYSSALAVENLWLAARAEGLGVGWVSFFDEREMVRALGLPEHLEVVAYLCVGYVDEFPEEPELMQAGWSKRRPLSWVVHEETYGRRALPGEEPHDLLAETVAQIRPLDAKALGEAWERQKRMTKPAGALGMLEIISAQLSGLSRQCPPPIPEPAAVAIFAGDHGVHAQGVTPWPQEVTAQMVANFLGGGAVCNAFANQVGAEVCIVDVGVAAELPSTPGLLPRKVGPGTADMTTGPAMTREEAKQAIEVGIETARDLVAAGNKALLTGEMGIANTTASAALISVFTGTDPAEVTGRGTGINDETLARKTEVVRRAIELHQPDPADPIGVLAAIGGLEHAALVGLLLGGASLRTPVILDGVSAGAAALVARAIAPEVLAACIAGHRSAEPGHVAALNKLGLRPLVDLDLRLGEGTGALLALPLVQSTARAMHEVATFDSAGVTEK